MYDKNVLIVNYNGYDLKIIFREGHYFYDMLLKRNPDYFKMYKMIFDNIHLVIEDSEYNFIHSSKLKSVMHNKEVYVEYKSEFRNSVKTKIFMELITLVTKETSLYKDQSFYPNEPTLIHVVD